MYESFEECAKRETFEETGILIDNVKHITTINTPYPEEGKHTVTVLVSADWIKNEAKVLEPDKFSERE